MKMTPFKANLKALFARLQKALQERRPARITQQDMKGYLVAFKEGLRALPHKFTREEMKARLASLKEFYEKWQQKGQNAQEKQEETEFMPPLLAAHKRTPTRFSSMLLKSIFLFFFVAVLWAHWAQLDEVTHAEGKVIPSSQIKMISHLEGGIIKEILVREGDIVEKGQLLLRIDNTVAESHYEEGITTYYSALAAVERLKAQAYGHPFQVPENVATSAPETAKKEMTHYQTALERFKNEQAIATREVEQKRQDFLQLKTQVTEFETQYELALQEIAVIEPMVKKGLSPKVELLRLKREISDLQSRKSSAEINIPKAEAALQQAEEKLTQVEIAFRNDALRELKDAEQKLADAKDSKTTGKDRLSRTEVRSPVRGTVKELMVNTIGGVVQPGHNLIAIVPLEDTLLVEAQVLPSDVAFLRPGLPATVKITAFDYSLYGGLEGQLVDISADTIQDEKKQSFFRIRVRTQQNHLGTEQQPLSIMPGMTAQVDIMTGKRSVLQYLLNPIFRARDMALRER